MADPTPRVDGAVTLADGRALSFAEYGEEGGDPVLWFHGTPGSRRQLAPSVNEIAERQGVRIIAVERPGVGRSSAHRYHAIVDWAADIEQLADELGIGRFAVVGLSGGGPYVLACAHEMPDRVVAGAVLGGVAPTQGPEATDGGLVSLASRFRVPLRLVAEPLGFAAWGAVRLLRPLGPQALELYLHFQPEGDQRVFRLPGMKEMFLQDMQSGAEHRYHAVIYDAVLFGRDWGFSISEIRVPIRFWHGDEDHIVPLAHGEHVAALVPDSELWIRRGESHLGALDSVDEILDTLLDLWPDRKGDPGLHVVG